MNMLTARVVGIVCAVGVSACTVSQTETPALTGPSTFATSVGVTASPDILNMGQTSTAPGQTSQIVVSAFDATGQPKTNQAVRLDTFVNGATTVCGQLSTRMVTTGSDGRALALFTAPGTPPNCPNFNADGTITIRATPVGSQASTAATSSVNVAMVLPSTGVSGGAFTANLSIAPISGIRNFQFDGTSSVSPGHTITTFAWTFSDGAAKSGPIVSHDFSSAGTFTVTLTVTDEAGQQAFKTAIVTVTG